MIAFKWAHATAGLDNPCKSELLRNIVESAKRKLSHTIKKKDPVTADIMKMLFQRFDTSDSTLTDLRLSYVLFILCWFFLRYDEDYLDIFIIGMVKMY